MMVNEGFDDDSEVQNQLYIQGDLLHLQVLHADDNDDNYIITHHKYNKGVANKTNEEDDCKRNGNHKEGQDTYHHLHT